MKTINIGYVALASHTPKQSLYPDWWSERLDGKRKDPKQIVIPAGKVFTLKITYPLTTPFTVKINTGKKGLTRAGIVNRVVSAYKKIYALEDKDTGETTGNITGMLNRQRSNGRFGIWGHSLDDLMLHTINVDSKKMELTVGVDS